MTISTQKKITLLAIIGLLYWFFGNLYEAVVISPNWVIDSPGQLKRLNDFFVETKPMNYFVPFTQLATISVWLLLWKNKENSIKIELQRASIFAVLVTALNVIIVSTIVLKLFAPDFEKYGAYLSTLTWRWNVLNFFRMIMVAITVYYLFNAYRKLDWLGQTKNS
jgi:hypothetical protein